VLNTCVIAPLLLESVLDLEQVGEVACGFDADFEVDWLRVVVEDRELLVEAVADRPPANHRQLGVDVNRSGSGNEEEPRLEVLKIVDREWVEPFAVHGQDPLREKAVVEREKAGGVGERSLDVAAGIADHERVAVENLDQVVVHLLLLGGPGKRRWNSTGSSRSPSIPIDP